MPPLEARLGRSTRRCMDTSSDSRLNKLVLLLNAPKFLTFVNQWHRRLRTRCEGAARPTPNQLTRTFLLSCWATPRRTWGASGSAHLEGSFAGLRWNHKRVGQQHKNANFP